VEQGLRSIGGRGRSLGTGDEGFGLLDGLAALGAADALATVVDAVAATIAAALPAGVEVLLFGGGARNRTLVQALRARLPERPVTVGGPPASRLVPEAREAACMAVLGLLAADGVRITLPAVTGRGETYFLDGRWLLPR
jgi:anhydro-N-acetylmuramic acid kinase